MPDRAQIVTACLAQLRKVASAHPDGLAKPLGVSVATLIPILDSDARFARVAGPGGWWWKLADAAGVTSATSLDELQRQLADARREIATLKAEVARLSAPPAPSEYAQEIAARGVDYREVLPPGNSRPREPGGWFAATLRRLGGEHTIAEIANADRRELKAAATACSDAAHADLIERVGKRGRAFLWRLKAGAA